MAKEFIFFEVVGILLFLGSFDFTGQIFSLGGIVKSYVMLTVGLTFLFISFMLYVDARTIEKMKGK
ncbi:MAG: hypothetical protein IH845_01520 [Nanoarchaeota archaeon]|nr:hypothetical protein [Nanoarchaeota archaeon]